MATLARASCNSYVYGGIAYRTVARVCHGFDHLYFSVHGRDNDLDKAITRRHTELKA